MSDSPEVIAAQLANSNHDVLGRFSQEQIEEKFSDDELAEIANEILDDETEEIAKTTATQIAFARTLAEEFTYDGDEINFVIGYGPEMDDDDSDETDEEPTPRVEIFNGQHPNRREGWRIGVFLQMAEAFAAGNGAQIAKFLDENEKKYADLSMESSRKGIGSILQDRGHSPDSIMSEFGVEE